ncbi:MAG: hypothetical protein RJA76_780 [Bacteroidota bacterium]|jgi:uncharacterized damage-inducible protein DinB
MNPPAITEYPKTSYFAEYLNFSPSDTLIEELKKNELFVLNIFESLNDQELTFRYEENKWSIKELIGHLADTEKIFSFRSLSIARGETNALPGFDENLYVQHAQFDSLSANQLIQYYFANRTATLALIETLDERHLSQMGSANGQMVSARALLWMIAGHEKHHLSVINERYLPLLNKK